MKLPKLPAKKPAERRSAARESISPPAKYYRSGQISDKAASPFKSKPKPKKGRAKKLFFGVADIVLLAVLLLGLVYSLLVKPDPKVIASSNVYHSSSDYQQAVVKQFQQLKNRNKISLDEVSIINSLQSQFPEVADADVELPLFGETPIVHLGISQPSFFLASANKSFVVDSRGRVAAEAASLPAVKSLPELIDQTGFNTEVGRQTLSASDVAFITTVVAQMKHAKVPLKSLTLPSLAQELDVRTTDQPYFIKFYLGGDALLQSGQFLAARNSFNQGGQQPAQYLDVRVPGKIFYK